MTHFSDLNLHVAIQRAVGELGYATPTPIQQACIPQLMAGADIMGIAQTGTGKTAAYVLPLLNRIYAELDHPSASKRQPKSCRALVLVPTRELAAQVAASIKTYCRFRRAAHVVIMGGVKAGPQIRALGNGVDIAVATPGRLMDLMSVDAARLDACRTVVLDEADQMLDMGFIPAIRKIMAKIPKPRQTVLFSATMPPQIKSLANDFLNNPKQISVAPAAKPIERIDQRVVFVEKPEKRRVLLDLIKENKPERAIIFVRTKRGADNLERFLSKAGVDIGALHGDKSQGQRTGVMQAFRGGTLNMLVATDIAARGIDVDDVTHVFNYELPNVPEAYVHRIGRTARAGKTGKAFALCAHDERPLLRDIEKLIGVAVKRLGVEGFEPDMQESEAELIQKKDRRPTNRQDSTPAKRGARRGGPGGRFSSGSSRSEDTRNESGGNGGPARKAPHRKGRAGKPPFKGSGRKRSEDARGDRPKP